MNAVKGDNRAETVTLERLVGRRYTLHSGDRTYVGGWKK